MAEGKNKIIFYRDWVDQFRDLTDDEAGRLIKHIMLYVNDENPTPPDRLTELLFKPFKAQLKRDLDKWEAKSQQASEAAKKRWKVDGMRTHADASKTMRKNADKDKVIIDKVIIDINIPSREEFVEYCLSKKQDVDPVHAGLKYDAWVENGWKDGNGKPVKNWKSKLINTIPHLNTTKARRENPRAELMK